MSDFDVVAEGKIGVLDIESTDLNAEDGRILCACIKTVLPNGMGGDTKTFQVRKEDFTVKDGWNDKRVVKELVDAMNEYDLILTWYGSRFDIPFINTRALKHRIRPPFKKYRRDLCFIARGSFKLKNNKLFTWGQFLFGQSGKSRLAWALWLRCMRGCLGSLKYIVKHCEKDVAETEKIYKEFLPVLGKLKKGGPV